MRTFNTNEMTQQFDNLFMAPARAYMSLSIDYSEKLLNAQLDANKAYVDTGIADKVVSLQQDFLQKSQKLTEDNVKQAQATASKMSKTA